MQNADSPQRRKVTFNDRLLARYLPAWVRVIYFAILFTLIPGIILGYTILPVLNSPTPPIFGIFMFFVVLIFNGKITAYQNRQFQKSLEKNTGIK